MAPHETAAKADMGETAPQETAAKKALEGDGVASKESVVLL